jgi:RimJ/RimL family protein N-acetyltransferase
VLPSAIHDEGVIGETGRLRARRFRADDWRDLHAYLSMPEVYRFEPGAPIDEVAAQALVAERAEGIDFIALELLEVGRVVGHCSFLIAGEPDLRTRELGFIVNPRYWGRGVASEGGRLVVEYGFRQLGLHRVFAECNPQNTASWKTLERIGFVREGHFRSNMFRLDRDGLPVWQDTYHYGLLPTDIGLA